MATETSVLGWPSPVFSAGSHQTSCAPHIPVKAWSPNIVYSTAPLVCSQLVSPLVLPFTTMSSLLLSHTEVIIPFSLSPTPLCLSFSDGICHFLAVWLSLSTCLISLPNNKLLNYNFQVIYPVEVYKPHKQKQQSFSFSTLKSVPSFSLVPKSLLEHRTLFTHKWFCFFSPHGRLSY